MAHAVGITSGRLAEARKDAAEILEEIELQQTGDRPEFERRVRAIIGRSPELESPVLEEMYAEHQAIQKRQDQLFEAMLLRRAEDGRA